MSNPFKSKQFRDEFLKWDKRLKDEGFKDIEPFHQKSNVFYLKRPEDRLNSNSNAVSNRDQTLSFFLHLDWLITHFPNMPKFDRKILQLYSDGVYIKEIARRARRSNPHIRNRIRYYKHLILAIMAMLSNSDNHSPLRAISDQPSEVTANAEDRNKDKAA